MPPTSRPDAAGDAGAGIREHHLVVERTARYATLGDPRGPIRQVWFACHGYRQLAARFLRRFQSLDDGSRLVVAPEALNRFYIDDGAGPHGPEARIGATWMTRADRLNEIRDYVGYLDRLHDRIFQQVDRGVVELVALGFSQGAATASRWAALGRARPDRLILWAASLPPDLDLDAAAPRLRDMDLVLVAGADDAYGGPPQASAAAGRLRAHGIPCRVVAFSGGHRIDEAVLADLADAPPAG